MIVSVNWLKKFTTIDLPIDELATLIGSRLVEIENVIDLGKKYEGVIIAKIVECQPIEDSDHLNVTKIDDGGAVQNIDRDENGYVQVVCGAPNVRAGLTVAWLPPGSTVPETYGDEPFVLGARELRGVMSNGMLASAKELDLFDDHTGILELEPNKKPGESFAEAYELNDYLLDIENKSLTHRPDTFGIIGFAREVAAIQGKQFETPKSLRNDSNEWIERSGSEPTPVVTIDNPELSHRYQAVVLTNVDAKAQSPLDTQTYLARVGVRPHSAVVDATNYLMMVTGQPLHAFDYDKLKAVNNGAIDIHVRGGRPDEKLVLLDGREIELSENDIVIANGETAVALAGAMGGRDTEIDENTQNVLLESATFNLFNLRNTQFRHGVFSEAITRFTKGQPAELTAPVLAEAVKLLNLSAGAERTSDVADAYPVQQEFPKVYAMADHMNAALGTDFATNDIVQTLTNVEFDVSVNDDGVIAVVAPYWRADIHISEDLDEEVGRLNGFDSITPSHPKRNYTAVSPSQFDQFRAKVRRILERAGANEVLTYSFIHGDLIAKAGQQIQNAYRIVNSISPDLQYYRLTLTPSLLSLIHPNTKVGYDTFAVFELNKTHSKVFGMADDQTPNEVDMIALAIVADGDGAAYYHAKRFLDYLAVSLSVLLSYRPIDAEPGNDESAPFDFRRSAMVYAGDTYIGIVGEYKSSVKKAFKLTSATAGFELDPRTLHEASQNAAAKYEPLSRYPSTSRDVRFTVSESVHYADVIEIVRSVRSDNLTIRVDPIDIYHEHGSPSKNITFRCIFTPYAKTLSADEIAGIESKIIDAVTTNKEIGGASVV